MKKFFKITAFIFSLFAFVPKVESQVYPVAYAGFEHQNQGFANIGGRLLIEGNIAAYRVGAGVLMGATKSKFSLIPKIDADIILNSGVRNHSATPTGILIGGEATNYFIAPRAGLTFFGLLDLTAGYGFNYKDKSFRGRTFEGPNLNASLNIPLQLIFK